MFCETQKKQSKLLNDKGPLCSFKGYLIFEFQGAGWVMILSVWFVFLYTIVSFKEKAWVSYNC